MELITALSEQIKGNLDERMSDFILNLAIAIEEREGRPCLCCNNDLTEVITDKIHKKEVVFRPSEKALNAFIGRFAIWQWDLVLHMMQGRKDMLTKESLVIFNESLENRIRQGDLENADKWVKILFRDLTADEIKRAKQAKRDELQRKRVQAIENGKLGDALKIAEEQGMPLTQEELKKIAG